MEYCARCMYPANAKPTIIIDDEGICSGCRYHESRQGLNWTERGQWFGDLLEQYKARARAEGNPYDCIIPVSGGKDSHFQVYLMTRVYGMRPLLVTFNHTFNTRLGIRNLRNMIKVFGCDLLRITVNPIVVQKLARYMVKRVGDITWHYHCGIFTFPFRVAVNYRIPLMIWGEQAYSELTGMFRIEDMPEFTTWVRKEHDMRGIDLEDICNAESGLTMDELGPYVFPTDEQIAEIGVRGIYLSNYMEWDAKEQAELMRPFGFSTFGARRDRTFCQYAKTDDHANDVHDYLKFLKFGYGRATDDASIEIRHGRMTRDEGIEMVRQYDAARPRTLDTYLKFIGMTEQEFVALQDAKRDPDVWERDASGVWRATDWVGNHAAGPKVDAARVPQVKDRTFSYENRALYYSDTWWTPTGLKEPQPAEVARAAHAVEASAGGAVAVAPAPAAEAVEADDLTPIVL